MSCGACSAAHTPARTRAPLSSDTKRERERGEGVAEDGEEEGEEEGEDEEGEEAEGDWGEGEKRREGKWKEKRNI